MKAIKKTVLTIVTSLLLTGLPLVGATPAAAQNRNQLQLENQVRHELVMLPYYGVFDNLAFSTNGGTVTLYGQVVRASTRSDAEHAIKRLPGVTHVVNNIEVLPLSRFDNNIRLATYRSIARSGGLYRYLQGTNPSLHIIVDNGHVTLEGVVSGRGDRTLAYMAANRVPGVFSVTNNLRLSGEGDIR